MWKRWMASVVADVEKSPVAAPYSAADWTWAAGSREWQNRSDFSRSNLPGFFPNCAVTHISTARWHALFKPYWKKDWLETRNSQAPPIDKNLVIDPPERIPECEYGPAVFIEIFEQDWLADYVPNGTLVSARQAGQ